MKIIKIDAIYARDYEGRNQFIPLGISANYNYYLVNDDNCAYEEVKNIPSLNNIVDASFNGIVGYVSYLSNEKIKREIISLQSQLDASDYKIIKMYEYSMMGKAFPYSLSLIHSERQLLRDKINELQQQIKPNKTWEELQNIVIDNRKSVN